MAWQGVGRRRRGQLDAALALTAGALAAEALEGVDRSTIWLEHAWTLFAASRFEEAIEAAQHGVVASGGAATASIGHLLLRQSQAETALRRIDDAIAHATEAQGLFEELQDLPAQAVALRILSGVQTEAGRHEDAAATLLRAMELAQRTGSTDELIGCLVNLGLVHLRLGNLDDAVKYDLQALLEAERVGHAIGAAFAQGNLAEALVERGDLGEAVIACKEAIRMCSDMGDHQGVADVRSTLALAYLRQGRLEEAAAEAEQAASLFEEVGDTGGAVQALEHAIAAAQALGDATRARSLEERARVRAAARSPLTHRPPAGGPIEQEVHARDALGVIGVGSGVVDLLPGPT